MPIALVILFACLGVGCLSAVVFWLLVSIETLLTVFRVPTARQGLAINADRKRLSAALGLAPGSPEVIWPSVCIIIPAHNEEQVIERVTRSLRAQDYPADRLRVCFALDRCTDSTAKLLEQAAGGDPRIGWIEIAECPPNWAGKVNAVHQAATRTPEGRSADLLLFADADTIFDPRCVSACVAMLLERRLGMLSLLSTLTSGRWFEIVVAPVCAFQMLVQYPLRRANRLDRRRPLANGQFMLFARDCYTRIGGHERARDFLLEDIQLSRLVELAGIPQGLFLASGMLRCEMYRTWAQFQRGWKRIITELCSREAPRIRKFSLRLLALSGLCPLISLLAACLWPIMTLTTSYGQEPLVLAVAGLGALGFFLMVFAVGLGLAVARQAPWTAILHPVGAFFTVWLMRRAAADLDGGEVIRWGGRAYGLEKYQPLAGATDPKV